MRTVAIIQARMGSTRLPGKVLLDLSGEPMLARVVQRVSLAQRIDQVVVATTWSSTDEAIVQLCDEHNWACFRGSEEDVLDRYRQAADAYRADIVVRVTSDCPLIDPWVIDKVVEAFWSHQPDYAGNFVERTYPRGLDTEVVSREALQRTWQEAHETYQRAHVTPYIYENPQLFTVLSVVNDRDYSYYRWTVDTSEDLAFAREVYARLPTEGVSPWLKVVALLDCEPELSQINAQVRQKDLSQT